MIEWQRTAVTDEWWALGTVVRGVVRDVVAEIYFDPDNKRGSWVWFTIGKGARNGLHPRGENGTFLGAVEAVERTRKIAAMIKGGR